MPRAREPIPVRPASGADAGPAPGAAGADTGPARPEVDPIRWVRDHGDALYGYAFARLGAHEDAEDVVQETLLAAMHGAAGFAGRSKESTWLIGILRHKILDLLRRRARESAWRAEMERELTGAAPDFGETGWWTCHLSSDWSPPRSPAEREEFLRVLEEAIAGLPPVMRQAFYLSRIDGLANAEICSILDVSRSNLWTLLHRARLRLRRTLDERWFGGEDEARP
jgi:RNA polymerase sigma-70 factor (ECF subfamily)